ncbi:hypothetical protein HY624_01190 [Candidatus Uhrbacteria bacterium]|nr:hypothetical protein [Candidatus Uhrbacteria bacterium]
MAPATAEIEAKRAALLGASWNQAQLATRSAADAVRQAGFAVREESEKVKAAEKEIATQEFYESVNKARAAVAISEGGPVAAEEQEKQEPTAQERLLQYPGAIALQNSIRAALTGVGIIWTIVYANFHGIGRIFKKTYFCAFGEEWTFTRTPELEGKAPPEPSGITRAVGWLELLILIAIDLSILISILQQFALMTVLVSAVIHPWDTFKQMGFEPFITIWDLVTGS